MNQSRADLNLETGKTISFPCIGYVKQRWGYVKQRWADLNLEIDEAISMPCTGYVKQSWGYVNQRWADLNPGTDKASHFYALYWVCETELEICESEPG